MLRSFTEKQKETREVIWSHTVSISLIPHSTRCSKLKLMVSAYSVAAFQWIKFHRSWYLHQLEESQFKFIYSCCNHTSICSFSASEIEQKPHVAMTVKTEVFCIDQWKEYYLLIYYEYFFLFVWWLLFVCFLIILFLIGLDLQTRISDKFLTHLHTHVETENITLKDKTCLLQPLHDLKAIFVKKCAMYLFILM